MSEQVFLSIGSNLGQRQKNLSVAIAAIQENSAIMNVKQASIYETEPLYYADQPAFLNTVIGLETTCQPLELLVFTAGLEEVSGRQPDRKKNLPRTLDIDILCWGDRILNHKNLVIPHPDLQNRRFVLIPWAEIAADYLVSKWNMTVRELLSICVDSSQVNEYN